MSIVQEIENLIQPILKEHHFELVDIHYRKEAGRWVLRLFIDKLVDTSSPNAVDQANQPVVSAEQPKGSAVTLDDCETVTNFVGSLLDSSDLLARSYNLEVSSPGINRPLKNESHFQKAIGKKVKISLYAPLSETTKQKNFSGILLNCKDQLVEIEDTVSGKVQIPFTSIARAHLDII